MITKEILLNNYIQQVVKENKFTTGFELSMWWNDIHTFFDKLSFIKEEGMKYGIEITPKDFRDALMLMINNLE